MSRMRCPKCGSKVIEVCPYCKTQKEQIVYASNIDAKNEIDKSLVHFTSVRPADVNFSQMLSYTIFLGLLGFHAFLVGRKNKGLFHLIVFIGCVCFMVINEIITRSGGFSYIIEVFDEIFQLSLGISTLIWLGDIFSVIFNFFKYPAILPEGDSLEIAKMKYEILIKNKVLQKRHKSYEFKRFIYLIIPTFMKKTKEKYSNKLNDFSDEEINYLKTKDKRKK